MTGDRPHKPLTPRHENYLAAFEAWLRSETAFSVQLLNLALEDMRAPSRR